MGIDARERTDVRLERRGSVFMDPSSERVASFLLERNLDELEDLVSSKDDDPQRGVRAR